MIQANSNLALSQKLATVRDNILWDHRVHEEVLWLIQRILLLPQPPSSLQRRRRNPSFLDSEPFGYTTQKCSTYLSYYSRSCLLGHRFCPKKIDHTSGMTLHPNTSTTSTLVPKHQNLNLDFPQPLSTEVYRTIALLLKDLALETGLNFTLPSYL